MPTSQLYMYSAKNWKKYIEDQGTLWAFQVTGTGRAPGPFVPDNANDFLDIGVGDVWTGEFIHVPTPPSRGGRRRPAPQDALENWSNTNNVFQFVRVEDIAYDPDNPRVVYFADTGNTRLKSRPATGRLFRQIDGTACPKAVDSTPMAASSRSS